MIPYPANQKRGVKGILRVDKKFRSHGSEDLKRKYHKRPAVEAVFSFLKTQHSMAANEVRGLKNVTVYAFYSLLSLVLTREASIHVWRIEKYLNKQIVKAAKQDKPDLVQALASLANSLKEYRELSGIPPPNFHFNEDRHIKKPRVKRSRLAFISIFGFVITRNLSNTALQTMSNQTQPGTEMIKFMIPIYPYLILAPAVACVVAYAFTLRGKHSTRTKHSPFSIR